MADQNPLLTVVIATISGGVAAQAINLFASSEIERDKFIYNIVATALEASSNNEREERLRFLLDTGFISESPMRDQLQEKLSRAETDPAALPQLRQPVYAAVAVDTRKRADKLCSKYSQISDQFRSIGDLQSSGNYSKVIEQYCAGIYSP